MDAGRYRDLYLSETREYLAALNRSLAALDTEARGEALEGAFRAAHTIKGMSATLGFDEVARLAHELEDRLEAVRQGREAVDRTLIDELFARADALEGAVEAAVARVPAGLTGGAGAEAGAAARRAGRVSQGDSSRSPKDREATGARGRRGDAAERAEEPGEPPLVMHVVIRPDAPLGGARAVLIRRNAEEVAPVLRMEPADPVREWGGELRLWFPADADRAALERAARAAGDVLEVWFEGAGGASRRDAGRGGDPSADGRAPEAGRDALRPALLASRHVRVEASALDDLSDAVGELAVLTARLREVAAALGGAHGLDDLVGRFERQVGDLQHTVLDMRMVPVGEVFDRFPRLVREAARALGRQVDFEIRGREIELDRAILEQVAEPLLHLLRNAVDHGLEPAEERRERGKPERGRLVLEASREQSSVVIRVQDDGRGVSRRRIAERARAAGLLPETSAGELGDDDLLRLMCRPGFTTAERVTGISGRGVGLDVVVNTVRRLGGALEMKTEAGRGTTFTVRLPLTLAIAQALRVQIGGEDYAIPLTHVAEAVELDAGMVGRVKGREVLRLRGEVMPLVRLRGVLRTGAEGRESAAVVTQVGERRAALAVDRLVGRDQILVKRFDAPIGALPFFSGVTLLADGRPALVLDPTSVL